ncbi:MAG: exodeoxyribonuclease VII small subunit [Clostridia bacterium]|nr:exodeoxyribonuclease VII small subunit [Clostridia bacterium]
MNALDEIVTGLEKGDLSLKDALDRYEAGHRLAKELQAELNQAEKRMQEIMNGKVVEAQDDV